jgi:hypothetical protein
VGADGDQRVHALWRANHPHPLAFLEAFVGFPNLIVLRLSGLKPGRRFVQDARKEEPQRCQSNAAKKGGKASPASPGK